MTINLGIGFPERRVPGLLDDLVSPLPVGVAAAPEPPDGVAAAPEPPVGVAAAPEPPVGGDGTEPGTAGRDAGILRPTHISCPDLGTPDGVERMEEFLVAVAHGGAGVSNAAALDAGFGFIVDVPDARRAVAVVVATAAALSGHDIRAALREPDAAWVAALPEAAHGAIREVLLGIRTPAEAFGGVEAGLRAAFTRG